jgi:hypothetical protein
MCGRTDRTLQLYVYLMAFVQRSYDLNTESVRSEILMAVTMKITVCMAILSGK